jgi:hypothetical protein
MRGKSEKIIVDRLAQQTCERVGLFVGQIGASYVTDKVLNQSCLTTNVLEMSSVASQSVLLLSH